jgi:acyl-CoA synthetase (AMP-forming)/AMP-acid ligase II
MGAIDFLAEVLRGNPTRDAIIWNGKAYRYEWLLDRFHHWGEVLSSEQVEPGTIAILEADFSPNSVALLLALVQANCVVVPLTQSVADKKAEFIEIAAGMISFQLTEADHIETRRLGPYRPNEFYDTLRQRGHPGLVLFSSGSTGKSKAAVHDFGLILDKFRTPRHALRTITFLLFDHIGGVNTLFYTLSNGGCVVTVPDRSPDGVLKTIQDFKVELLPTSPTFINLILLSDAHKRYDLSSLKTVTYGTEPMPESTLRRFNALFPNVKLLQTYGLSEVGILRSKSKSSDSLWVKVGGEGFETRVIDGVLQVKAQSAMLGYLNAPSPFTEDGWFVTGDHVEVDGEYIRILGRKSEIINVGGEKVYPSEVESVIQEVDNVAEATVYGERNAITGSIVCASIRLKREEDPKEFTARLKAFCRRKLQPYKVPVKVQIVGERQHSDRFKKMRPLS